MRFIIANGDVAVTMGVKKENKIKEKTSLKQKKNKATNYLIGFGGNREVLFTNRKIGVPR